MRRVSSGAAKQLPLVLLAVAILLPLYFLIDNSFKTTAQYAASPLALPSPFTIAPYRSALEGQGIARLFLNSAVISVSSVALATVFGALAAFALAKLEFRGRSWGLRLILPLMVVPPIALIVPQFQVFNSLGLIGNPASVILIYVGIMLPFTVYLLRNFFLSFPDELIESATLDGTGTLGVFARIVLPLSGPALLTSVIVNFVFAWNELLISLVFLQSDTSRTLVVGLTIFQSRLSLNVPVLMAGLTVASIPVLLVYLFGQRFLVRGLLSGSSK
jgi:ABC-type glycerol-3-phosphate transport system permease component